MGNIAISSKILCLSLILFLHDKLPHISLRKNFFGKAKTYLAYLKNNSYLCPIILQLRANLPPIHPRNSPYFCAIELRMIYVCCPFVKRTTDGQQSNINRTKVGGNTKKERRKIGAKVEMIWSDIRQILE